MILSLPIWPNPFLDYNRSQHFMPLHTSISGLRQPELYERYYQWAKHHDGYLNHVSKTLLANHDAGKSFEDAVDYGNQAHGFIKAPFLLARHMGSADLEDKLDLAVSALETSKLRFSPPPSLIFFRSAEDPPPPPPSHEVSRVAVRVLESIVRRGWTTSEA